MQNFRLSTANVKFHQICTLIGSFCRKYIKFQLEKYRRVMSHDTELNSNAKFQEKLTCSLGNDMRNLANFYQSTQKSQNYDFNGIFLSKVENV